ncbi:hypothetical protein D3C77_544590 [compost metagenome]
MAIEPAPYRAAQRRGVAVAGIGHQRNVRRQGAYLKIADRAHPECLDGQAGEHIRLVPGLAAGANLHEVIGQQRRQQGRVAAYVLLQQALLQVVQGGFQLASGLRCGAGVAAALAPFILRQLPGFLGHRPTDEIAGLHVQQVHALAQRYAP